MRILLIFLCILMFTSPVLAAETPNKDELKALMREVLRENPDLVLDAMRDQNEQVIEIVQQGLRQQQRNTLIAQWKAEVGKERTVQLEGRPSLGAADAPITLVAFSDFTCPYCRVAEQTLGKVLPGYTDKIRFVFKHVPREGNEIAKLASEYYIAASMQSPALAWKLYEKMFTEQESLLADGREFLQASATAVGLDMKKLANDLKSKQVKTTLEEDSADAQANGVTGTPYFLVNNVLVRGAVSAELFNDAIEIALQHKELAK